MQQKLLSKVIKLDKESRETKQKSDALQAEMNTLSKEIGKLVWPG